MSLQDGIVTGNYTDICRECIKDNISGVLEKAPKYGDLEYKEVFKVNLRGDSVCFCMKHFDKILGKYTLIDTSILTDEEINGQFENECYNKDIEQIDKQIVTETEPKKSVKKTTRTSKKKEADKNEHSKTTK